MTTAYSTVPSVSFGEITVARSTSAMATDRWMMDGRTDGRLDVLYCTQLKYSNGSRISRVGRTMLGAEKQSRQRKGGWRP